MYLVICYAIHNREIASIDKFDTEEEAVKFLVDDATNTYDEEIANSGNNPDEIELDIDENAETAILNDYPAECIWTWEVKEI